ncbi:major facilitator transporter [Caballeronia pedi]|uniref:Major facilitator transporter n=1 Tax=Caballeronia pedi TaxID=1777141 RepID=A0A158CME0_9BURK|nr:MFS transporter [Caballeronia pedi]SAK83508.1 major facilitator transporter [Caballeronia pedi]
MSTEELGSMSPAGGCHQRDDTGPPFGRIVSSIASLLLGFALLVMGNGLLGTLVALRMVHANFPAATIGFVQAAYYTGFMLGAWRGSAIIVRVGHHRAFAAFAALAACSALGYAVSSQAPVWMALRFMTGFSLVGIFAVMESWLNGVAPNAFRGRVFSVYLITTYLCVGAGQFLIGVASPNGFELFSLVAALFALSLVPASLARASVADSDERPAPAGPLESPPKTKLKALPTLWRDAPLALWGCFASGLLNSTFYALYPVYMRGAGYAVEEISHFMGVALIAALLPQWPLAHLSDRLDRARVIRGIALVLMLASATLFVFHGAAFVRPIAYLFVSLIFTIYGVSVAHANDWIASRQRVAASAGLLLTFALGGSIGPIAASFTMSCVGPAGLYLFSMCVTAALLALAWRNLRVRRDAASH